MTEKEKTLYWQLESNADLSATFQDLNELMELLKADFGEEEEPEEVEYTVTPVWLTQEEYESLPEL